MSGKVWVLLKTPADGQPSVMAVYEHHIDLLARVERIKKANAQYPTRRTSPTSWVVGPEDDEGFFGNKPIRLEAIEAKYVAGTPTMTVTVED